MSDGKVITGADLTERERLLLFWASFLSLAAAGFGFAFRIAHMGSYGAEFGLTGQQIGNIAGSCFWPIAITMIGFSLVVDKTGYKIPMFAAAALQAISGIGTSMATGYEGLLIFAICAGLGHGIIEAVINPICAAVYPRNKTTMLTVLHASWPAGIVAGTLLIWALDTASGGISWKVHALWIVIPAVIYGLMYAPCKFPVDERVQAGVPFVDMLKEVGFLGMALASFMLVYQLGGVFSGIFHLFELPSNFFFISLIAGLVIGAAFGAAVKSLGKPLFFMLCVLMIPVATAELSTDQWIKELMNPILGEYAIFAIVYSAGVMFLLRTFAGGIMKHVNPPVLMATSGILSAGGLLWLGNGAAGAMVFIAFTIYAIGQTYYWPCILGFVSERYPKGGALTLNTVSALALLSLGMVGNPILGVARDKSVYAQAEEKIPAVAEVAKADGTYLWMSHNTINPSKLDDYGVKVIAGTGSEILASVSPSLEANEELKKQLDEIKTGTEGDNKDDLIALKAYNLAMTHSGTIADETEQKAFINEIGKGISEDTQAKIKTYTDAKAELGAITVAAGRDVLTFAAWFPGILVVAFALIAIYFQTQGGYKPIYLTEAEDAEAAGEISHAQAEEQVHDAEEHAHEAAEEAAGSEL